MQTHYNYIYDSEDNSFNFTTKNDILYKVSFIVDETFSVLSGHKVPNIYQIVVEKVAQKIEPFDNKVSKTIESIIEHFFRKIENSILYVCSNIDDKERKRFEVFNRWYKNSKYKDIIVKTDNIIVIEENANGKTEIFTSFMYHKNNPNQEKIIEIYTKIEEFLSEDK